MPCFSSKLENHSSDETFEDAYVINWTKEGELGEDGDVGEVGLIGDIGEVSELGSSLIF